MTLQAALAVAAARSANPALAIYEFRVLSNLAHTGSDIICDLAELIKQNQILLCWILAVGMEAQDTSRRVVGQKK